MLFQFDDRMNLHTAATVHRRGTIAGSIETNKGDTIYIESCHWQRNS
jgi:hypothetical protein